MLTMNDTTEIESHLLACVSDIIPEDCEKPESEAVVEWINRYRGNDEVMLALMNAFSRTIAEVMSQHP